MIEMTNKDAQYIADKIRDEYGYEITSGNVIGFVIGLKAKGIEVYTQKQLISRIVNSIRNIPETHSKTSKHNIPSFIRY